MVHKKIYFKSLSKVSVLLLLSTLFLNTNTLRQELQIPNVQISLDADFSILPHENTKDQLCNDDFTQNVYAQLSYTYLQIYKNPDTFQSIDVYKNELVNLHQRTLELAEQLAAFITLKINPKPLISPTYIKTYKLQHDGNRDYQAYPAVDVLSEPFMNRLQKDKQMYVFIKRTETITKNTKLMNSQVVQNAKRLFLHYYPEFDWIGNVYVPVLYGLETSEEILDQQSKFSINHYRFWNIRMYRAIKSDDVKGVEVLINNLKDQNNQITDNEARVFACDLYAAMLFEFQCLLQLDNASSDEQIQSDFSLFRIIQESLYSEQQIRGINTCRVAIPPQEFFAQNILGLSFMFQQQQIQKQKIGQMLHSGITDDFSSEIYIIARYFFEFDLYIIDFLNGDLSYHHMTMKEMKTMYFYVMKFKQSANIKDIQHLNIIFNITLKFLDYLAAIYDNQELLDVVSREGIIESVKVQYLIFTYMRIKALELGDFSIFVSWEEFINSYLLIFKRKLNPDDELIQYVGQDRYYNTILINIEIITYILYQKQNTYRILIYEILEETIQHALTDLLVQENINDLLKIQIKKYTMITDDDFVVPRIIEKVFLQDRIEDMLKYLNEKTQKHIITDSNEKTQEYTDNFDDQVREVQTFETLAKKNKPIPKQNLNHLIEKRLFYNTLIEVLYATKQFSNNAEIKGYLQKRIQSYQKQDTSRGKEYKLIYDKISTQQIDYKAKQIDIYNHIYQYAISEITMLLDRENSSEAFLSFIELYKEVSEVQFERLDSHEIDEAELRNLQFIFQDKIIDEKLDYNDKWNETIFIDAVFLYPFLYVKHRQTSFQTGSNECQSYSPDLMTTQEAHAKGINGNELTAVSNYQKTQCLEKRQEAFQKFLLDEDLIEQSGMTQYDFINHIVLSPELYLQIEQLEFMIDAFQIFKIFKKVNGRRVMTDNILNEIFFDIYKFIIQIRSDPNFVYNFDFWGTITNYIEKCMSYQRFSSKQGQKYYFCALGYARYNEMYWFIKDAHYKAAQDFEILKSVWFVDRSNNGQNKINWGDRTHGRFDYFTHYLTKIKTFNQYKSDDQDMIDFNEDNNWKSEIWDECSKLSQLQNNVDYCRFLYKVGRIIDQFKDEDEPIDNQYQVISKILIDNINDDNDKIITWEVLDFFQFEFDYEQEPIIEDIRQIFDSEMIKNIKNGVQTQDLSQLLSISDTKLIADYAMSKYDENTTIRSINDIQHGLQDIKKDDALHNLISDNYLVSEEKILNFLQLKQSEAHNSIFDSYKIIHHIPLSLLLFYADEFVEFERIAKVLKKMGKLEMLFLGDVKAGQLIVTHFGAYIKGKFQQHSKDAKHYTIANLETFITGVERKIGNNRNIKDLKIMKNQMNGKEINLQFKKAIASNMVSLGHKTPTVQIQTNENNRLNQNIKISVVQEQIDPKIQVIGQTVTTQEIQDLNDQERVSIRKETIQEDLIDKVTETKTQTQQLSNKTIQDGLQLIGKSDSIQTENNEVERMQDQSGRLTVVSTKTIISQEPITEQKIIGNLQITKVTGQKTILVRRKKEQVQNSRPFVQGFNGVLI